MKLSRARKVLRYTAAALALLLLPVLLRLAAGNFGTVVTGHVYRSAQMGASSLGRAVRDHGVKTVLNLRGSHPGVRWYDDERSATLAAGATQVDVAMSSCEWMSRDQLRTLIDVLDQSDYPLLVHCWRGAERTGLVSAFVILLRPGSTLGEARAQFSPYYLYFPVGDGVVMPGHLDQYEKWLKAHGLSHSPEEFRRWVAGGYSPGKPSREDWPYDPYPLKVVTRPDGESRRQ